MSGDMRYNIPKLMRYSTIKEREEYYLNEFNPIKLINWFNNERDSLNTIYAVNIGRHTNIFQKKFSNVKNNMIIIDKYKNWEEIIDMFTYFKPEGVYYDRNYYKDIKKCSKCSNDAKKCWKCKNFMGQELAFDIDPENINCPIHGGIDEKMAKKQGLSFCEIEFEMVKKSAEELYEILSTDFEKLKIVYSGRGIHIHVFDDSAIKMTLKERQKFSQLLVKKGCPIDEWVSNGKMRLIRLPYSLHGMVSRIVIPIEKKELTKVNPIKNKKYWPKFMI